MELTELRTEINRIDDELLKLFVKRMEISAQIAKYKQSHGLPIYVPERENEILQNISGKVAPDLSGYARALYQTLFTLSKNYQKDQNK